jgi:hypothetical protein
VSRTDALTTLRSLATGLLADPAGSARLLERISQHDDAEALRCYLVEAGATAVIEATSSAVGTIA